MEQIINSKLVQYLIDNGGSRWTKDFDGRSYDRVYFTPEQLGLTVNVSEDGTKVLGAELNGRTMTAYMYFKFRKFKTYYDCLTNEVVGKCDAFKVNLTKMIEEFENPKQKSETKKTKKKATAKKTAKATAKKTAVKKSTAVKAEEPKPKVETEKKFFTDRVNKAWKKVIKNLGTGKRFTDGYFDAENKILYFGGYGFVTVDNSQNYHIGGGIPKNDSAELSFGMRTVLEGLSDFDNPDSYDEPITLDMSVADIKAKIEELKNGVRTKGKVSQGYRPVDYFMVSEEHGYKLDYNKVLAVVELLEAHMEKGEIISVQFGKSIKKGVRFFTTNKFGVGDEMISAFLCPCTK